jgi:hypothetical protein
MANEGPVNRCERLPGLLAARSAGPVSRHGPAAHGLSHIAPYSRGTHPQTASSANVSPLRKRTETAAAQGSSLHQYELRQY